MHMMKQPFKLSRILILAILFLAGGFPLPLFAKGKDAVRSAHTASVYNSASFCASIDTLGAKVADDIALTQARYESKRAEDVAALEKRLMGRDAAKADARSSWDSKRDQLYMQLAHRAKTDAQRAAIAVFTTNVDTATRARRKEVDDAVSAFRASIDAASQERQKGIDDAIAVFKKQTQDTLLAAKADCGKGTPPPKVRAAYTKDMKQAKDDFSTDLKALEKRHDVLRTIPDDRQAAVVRAAANFKSALASAEAQLKQSFSNR